jgi:hypothetical protein
MRDKSNDMDFTFSIDENGVNLIVDEKGSNYLALRKVKWFDNDYKLELRRWTSTKEGERPGKGVTFLTEEGPHELAEALVKEGYGNTATLLDALNARDEEDMEEEDYYDPRKILG